MANEYFQFKHFTINQDQCAMKVGTDGVLLGAWVEALNPKFILDVGTGTGLIALMLSQRFPKSKVTGIELDSSAYGQAVENVKNSPYHNNISMIKEDFNKYHSPLKYDLIICNPPFFTSGTPSTSRGRSIARHAITLSYENLISQAKNLLSNNGKIAFIAPIELLDQLLKLIERYQLHTTRECIVYPNKEKESKRILLELSMIHENKKTETLVLEKQRHEYTEEAKALFQNFYLKL
ncbi:MAG: tRNA1Val (adenine37-N6)-methyltransferase [Patiriisocius sp.]|jgi:tRNA1Val (adenine37-N6)-methyltransferase